jgi:hypothetical protein
MIQAVKSPIQITESSSNMQKLTEELLPAALNKQWQKITIYTEQNFFYDKAVQI